ncbi:hypothetical protein TNCV_4743531 [Trichonephila clavipes]|nr:hypothetical protein TNCV_4743531 [Trichonephila clavipes]
MTVVLVQVWDYHLTPSILIQLYGNRLSSRFVRLGLGKSPEHQEVLRRPCSHYEWVWWEFHDMGYVLLARKWCLGVPGGDAADVPCRRSPGVATSGGANSDAVGLGAEGVSRRQSPPCWRAQKETLVLPDVCLVAAISDLPCFGEKRRKLAPLTL